jgi:hypothetical protein
MIRRDPIEVGGTYYRIIPEGEIKNYDGVLINLRRPRESLDLNRNFPANWRPESEQFGAGDFPTSEPEARNLVEFLLKHKNITSTISFHTMSGVLLRGFSDKPDLDQSAEDLWVYETIGQKGTDLTGYPHISTFHEFKYHPKQIITGAFDEWAYEHLGLYSWTVEFWSPQKQAGIENIKYIDWYREHPIADDLKLLKWNDEVLHGKGFVDWHPYDHPQLGKVELGGWDFLHSWANVPPEFLEKEISPFPDWIVWHALISPKLGLWGTNVTSLGDDLYQVRLVVQNEGWLPSYISKKGLERKVTRGVIAEIKLPKGAKLVSGQARMEIGELEGRSYKTANLLFDETGESTSDRAKAEWLVKAKKGTKIKLTAWHDRAGKIQSDVELK